MVKWPFRNPGPLTRIALSIGALATVIRLIWVVAMSRTPRGLSDPALYLGFARHIAEGQGYISLGNNPTAYYPPGYPYFLGVIQWVLNSIGLGHHLVLTAGIVQSLLGGVTAAIVTIIGARLGAGLQPLRSELRIAVAAGVVIACWPNLIIYSSLMLSETLFLAVFTAMFLAVLSISDSEDGRLIPIRVVTAACLLGACTLIRPQSTLLVAPGIVLVWIVSRKGWGWIVRAAGSLALGVLLILTPWVIRNAVQLNAFIPISTNTGDNLCIGFNPDSTGGFMLTEHCETGEKYIDSTTAEVRHDAANRSEALRWAASNLTRLPGLSLDKLKLTFVSDTDGLRTLESFGDDRFLSDGTRMGLGVFSNVYYYIVLGLACLGTGLLVPNALRNRSEDSTAIMLLMITAAGLLIPVLSFGDTRFKVPLAPCLALLAAAAINSTIARFTRDRIG